MAVNPEDSTLVARLIDLAADMKKELDEEAILLSNMNDQHVSDEEPDTWRFMLGEYSGRQKAWVALSAFIIAQADDIKGSLEPHLAELPNTDS